MRRLLRAARGRSNSAWCSRSIQRTRGNAAPCPDVWIRAVDQLPDDDVLHRCLLAYVSDFHLLGTATLPHAHSFMRQRQSSWRASITRMWFHRPAARRRVAAVRHGQPERVRLARLRPRQHLRARRPPGRQHRAGRPDAHRAPRGCARHAKPAAAKILHRLLDLRRECSSRTGRTAPPARQAAAQPAAAARAPAAPASMRTLPSPSDSTPAARCGSDFAPESGPDSGLAVIQVEKCVVLRR